MSPMPYDCKIRDRKVGRNAQLFSQAIAQLGSARARFPYLRILVSLVETAHPEWCQADKKDRQIARLVTQLSGGALNKEEVADVVRVRDGRP